MCVSARLTRCHFVKGEIIGKERCDVTNITITVETWRNHDVVEILEVLRNRVRTNLD